MKKENVSPNKFAELPFLVKGVLVAATIAIFLLYCENLFSLAWLDWKKYIMMLFFVPVYSLCAMPFLTFLGVAKFKSELLFLLKKSETEYEIHFGSLFDCLMSGLFNNKRGSFRNLMLYFFIDGVHGIMEDISNEVISPDATIKGSSYFFSDSTAKKFGLTSSKTIAIHKYILYANIVEIALVHSFSRGRLSFPDFAKFKTVEGKASEILKHKDHVSELRNFLKSKVNL